jgi:hypothetical protein
VYGAHAASVSLYFDGLPADLTACMTFRRPRLLADDVHALASADLVVVVREFEHMVSSGALDLLNRISVPFVWFTDDNLVALGREVRPFRYYTPASVSAFLAHAKAVVVTSMPLAEAMTGLHHEIVTWPCVFDARLAWPGSRDRGDAFRVGAFGGSFRSVGFCTHVLPALADFRATQPCEMFAVAGLAQHAGAADVVSIPLEQHFPTFVAAWQKLGLRAVVHPYGATRNIASKSRGSVLAAAYLGAVPIVGEEPAYDELDEDCGVLKAGADHREWLACLRRLSDPREAERLFGRLDAWCRSRFDPENARAPFAALAAHALAGGEAAREARRQTAARWPLPRRTSSWTREAARRFKNWRRSLTSSVRL